MTQNNHGKMMNKISLNNNDKFIDNIMKKRFFILIICSLQKIGNKVQV